MIIGLDFDGTCVTHDYPLIGKDIGAVPILKKLVDKKHRLMLWTMRGNKPNNGRNTLAEAVDWFKTNEIYLWGINENPEQQASGWSNSHKQYAELYLDDAAIFAPLKLDLSLSSRPFIDWEILEKELIRLGIL